MIWTAAIDPGASAGLAVITPENTLLTVACKENLTDAFDLLTNLTKNPCIIGIEKVHAIWGASASSTFTFGMNYGFWIGILKYLGLSYVDIKIKDWQDAMTIAPQKPDTKKLTKYQAQKAKKIHKDLLKMESLRAAKAAFPNAHFPTHDVADAVNMARFLRHTYELQG